MKEIKITKEISGGRLDKIVSRYLDKAPKGFVYKMLRKKNIVLNDHKAQGKELLKEGDCIRLYLADETIEKFRSTTKKSYEIKTENGPDPAEEYIVFEDENLIAFNKPSGMLSQKAGKEDRSMNDLLIGHLAKTDAFGKETAESSDMKGFYTPGISNRLDRNTSGLILAGKNLNASRELNNALKERRIDKYYLCLVKGKITKKETIDGFLVKDERSNKVKILKRGTDQKAARILTAYEPLAGTEEITLLQVELITGKSHQIRAHLASIGHPLLGDPKYGEPEANKKIREKYGLKRQALHAYKIFFREMNGTLSYLNGREIKAPVPEDLAKICKEIPELSDRKSIIRN